MLRDVTEMMSGSTAVTDYVAPCHGLLSHVSDDVTLRHCCSFTYSPTVIQRKLVALMLAGYVVMFFCAHVTNTLTYLLV